MIVIRKGIILMLLLMIVGLFFIIFNNMLIEVVVNFLVFYVEILDVLFCYMVGILVLYVMFGIVFLFVESY